MGTGHPLFLVNLVRQHGPDAGNTYIGAMPCGSRASIMTVRTKRSIAGEHTTGPTPPGSNT
jgi:hypothetical protein